MASRPAATRAGDDEPVRARGCWTTIVGGVVPTTVMTVTGGLTLG